MSMFKRDPEVVGKEALEAFWVEASKRANAVVRQIVFEATKAKMPLEYLQYVYYVLAEDSRHWPRLSDGDKRALSWALHLVKHVGVMPRYHDGLQVPSADAESAVDTTIEGMARWARTVLFVTLLKDFQGTIKKFAKAYGKAAPECASNPGVCLLAHMQVLARNGAISRDKGGDLMASFLGQVL